MWPNRIRLSARTLLGIAVLLAIPTCWTESAWASCGDHLLSPHESMTQPMPGQAATQAAFPGERPDWPRPHTRCHGANCSQGIPQVPIPSPIKIQVEDQSCWLTAKVLAFRTSYFWRRFVHDALRMPERRGERLDRPPRAV